MSGDFLPYGRQSLDDDDIAAVVETLKSDWLTSGPAVARFEQTLGGHTGGAKAVACSNGTAALHMAALALGLGPEDIVIVPSLSFLATANGPRMAGCTIRFCDVDPDTGLMTPETLQAAIAELAGRGQRARAVFPVHLSGQTTDMPAISAIARAHDLLVVEDACHALGADYAAGEGADRQVGSCAFSDMTIFSFHPVKTIAMGEGGAVTTRDPEYHRRLMQLRNHGMTRDADDFSNADMAFDADGAANPWYYEMQTLGNNYRVPDILCALGNSQLAKLPGFVARRREIAAEYDRLFAGVNLPLRPIPQAGHSRSAWHLYPLLIDFDAIGMSRAEVMQGLRARGVGTQVHYIPIHRQPYYRQQGEQPVLPGADSYYARTLSIPMFPALHDDELRHVVDAITDLLGSAA